MTEELLPKKISESEVTMTELVLPSHTNSLDSIFGGVIMSWIDICGAIAAQRHAGKEVVTASVDDLHFYAPVYKGWVVNLKARVNFVSRTSMEVGVRVEAEDPRSGKKYHTSSAYLTFVALGKDGKPTPIRALLKETEEDNRRWNQAEMRRQLRLKRRFK